MTASLFRDLENAGRIEADHIIGDLLARDSEAASATILRVSYVHMMAYEARMRRMAKRG
jgi:2-dehydropantoate 2-reductase